MSLKTAILDTEPTSYWPLNDVTGTSCHDEMGLHDALASSTGVKLAAVPFGAASAPYFDDELGSVLTVAADPQYSQPFANALTVATWICPLALDNAHTGGSRQYRSGKLCARVPWGSNRRAVPVASPARVIGGMVVHDE